MSDRLSLSEARLFPESPPQGSYLVYVEKFSRGNTHYVAAVRLVGPPGEPAVPKQQLTLPVDTGFLILAGSDSVDELRSGIKAAHSRILWDKDRGLDTEIVEASGISAGIVT